MSRRRRRTTILVGAALGLAATGTPVQVVSQTSRDVDRGRAVFELSGCARCHVPRAEKQGTGPPLEAIRRPQGAFQVAGRLWNHAPGMFTAFEREGLR
jgi:mono/diheme cytochrome c family protein